MKDFKIYKSKVKIDFYVWKLKNDGTKSEEYRKKYKVAQFNYW